MWLYKLIFAHAIFSADFFFLIKVKLFYKTNLRYIYVDEFSITILVIVHRYINIRSDTDYVLMNLAFWPKILIQQFGSVSWFELDECHCTQGRLCMCL